MKLIEVINKDIKRSRTLKAGKTYVIQGEVRVAKSVKLTVQDKVTILIVNGVNKKSSIWRSALIFEQGSSLIAQRMYVKHAIRNISRSSVQIMVGCGFWGILTTQAKTAYR